MAVQYLSRGLFPATLIAGLAVACGARGPLDITVIEVAPDAEVDAPATDASTDAADAQDATEDEGGGPGGFDAGPIVNCGSCVAGSCGPQLLACIESTGCRDALQCVVTTCLSGGTPSITCIEGCASSDGGSASTLPELIGAFTCIVESCGSQCTSVLGGLTGGGGAGAGVRGGGAGGGGG